MVSISNQARSINQQAQAGLGQYLGGGTNAALQFQSQMGLGDPNIPAFDVTQLPGYQQSMNQGIAAVNQGAASAGMLNSGERLKSLQQTGQSVFGDYYNNYMNRLQAMQSQGLSAQNSLTNTQTNNLGTVASYRAAKAAAAGGGGGGGGMAGLGDILGAGASMYGTYSGGAA